MGMEFAASSKSPSEAESGVKPNCGDVDSGGGGLKSGGGRFGRGGGGAIPGGRGGRGLGTSSEAGSISSKGSTMVIYQSPTLFNILWLRKQEYSF